MPVCDDNLPCMPLTTDGMQPEFYGANAHQQLLDKIAQLRRDMNHIQIALHAIEGPVRRDQAVHHLKPQFVGPTAQLGGDKMIPAEVSESVRQRLSDLHNWCLSALESYYSIVWIAFGDAMVKKVIQDFETKFKHFTSVRSFQGHH